MKEKRDQLPLVNRQIRVTEVQLITQDGTNIGTVNRDRALQMADDANLDLVMIAESGKEGIPVVKIMDFGKAAYEKKKKFAESKKHQKVIQIKEIKIRPSIGEHDYQTKIKQAVQFLKEGKRLKVTLFFRGREQAKKYERGNEMFEKVKKSFEEHQLLHDLIEEKDSKMGQFWSRIFYLKSK